MKFRTIYPDGVTEADFGSNAFCYEYDKGGTTSGLVYSSAMSDIADVISANYGDDFALRVWFRAGAIATGAQVPLYDGDYFFNFNGGDIRGGGGRHFFDSQYSRNGVTFAAYDWDCGLEATTETQFTGIRSNNGSDGSKPISITFVRCAFTGTSAAWNNTNHGLYNLTCENCEFSGSPSVYQTGSSGYGDIVFRGCTFTNCKWPFAQKSDSAETMSLLVEDCNFIDSGTGDADYPCMRFICSPSATGQVATAVVRNCTFNYTDGDPTSGAMLMFGEGRKGKTTSIKGVEIVTVEGCTATVAGESVPVTVMMAVNVNNRAFVDIPEGYAINEYSFDSSVTMSDVDWTDIVVPYEPPVPVEPDPEPTACGDIPFNTPVPSVRTTRDVDGKQTELGVGSQATGENATAIGWHVKARHDNAIALGVDSKAAGTGAMPTLSLPDAEHIYIGNVTLASLLGT